VGGVRQRAGAKHSLNQLHANSGRLKGKFVGIGSLTALKRGRARKRMHMAKGPQCQW